jgi:hypothetical protein
MSNVKLNPRRVIADRPPLDDAFGAEQAGGGLAGLEAELKAMREEFLRLHDLIRERERKGAMLIDAYKSVIADLADLFETQRLENVKREESLRFFLSTIESRLTESIEAALAGKGKAADAGAPAAKRRGWRKRG